MGIYTNLKCSKCKFSFTEGYRLGLQNSKLGIPLLKCPKCGTINKTNFKPWKRLSKGQKFQHWFWSIFTGFCYGGGIPLIVLLLLDTFVLNDKLQNKHSYLFLMVFLLGGISGTYISIKGTRINIKETDDIIISEEYQQTVDQYNTYVRYLKSMQQPKNN